MLYRVYPPIGIARIGDSDEFFVGPEVIGSRGREIAGAEVSHFKDATFHVRKQVARFHVYQQATPADPLVPAVLPAGAKIEWTVELGNKKDAIHRPGSPPGPIPAGSTLRPSPDPARANRFIHAKDLILSDAGPAGKTPLGGTHAGVPVKLGELRVDAAGKLLVFGGSMTSEPHPATPLTGFFYSNPDWHDEVSDGPVSARILLSDGTALPVEGAWVVVAPPDFAPGVEPIVILFDELRQVAIFNALGGPWTVLPATPAFTADIYPIIRRARSLGWSHMDPAALPSVTNEKNWTKISQDYAKLGANGAPTKPLRTDANARIGKVKTLLSDYTITAWQAKFLTQWVNDTFKADWAGPPPVAANPTAESLTRAALEGAVGQGFFPGIEAGRITTDPTIYRKPFDFRIDPTVLSAGDLTALMAQPWQADFLKCYRNWWPSQRPDLSPQPGGTFALWQRPILDGEHDKLVQNVRRLGMITVQSDAAGVQVSATEEGRDPTF